VEKGSELKFILPKEKIKKASSNGFLYFPLLALLTEINY
jgi:hypothetical protein